MKELNTFGYKVLRDVIKYTKGIDVRIFVDKSIERSKIIRLVREDGSPTGKFKIVTRIIDTGHIYPHIERITGDKKLGTLTIKILREEEDDIEYIRDQILLHLYEFPEKIGINYL